MADTRVATAEEIGSFRRDGFLKFDLTEVVGIDAFRGLRDAFHAAEARKFNFERDDFGQGDAPAMDRYYTARQHYPAINGVALSPLLGRFAALLAGAEHMQLFLAEIFIKQPGAPATNWHQDSPSAPIDRRGLMTFWIAIDDVDEDMGAMRYVPGSHRLGSFGGSFHYDVSRSGELPPEKRTRARKPIEYFGDLLRPDDWDHIREPVTVPVRAGEAIVHDAMTLHAAMPNVSNRTRRAFAVELMPTTTLYTGLPKKEFDDLGLTPYRPFDHPALPVVY